MPDPAMQDWRPIVGRNVHRLRQQNGMTQEQLAFEADLTYMGGMVRIAKALSVPVPKLLSE
jgi:hypothetical protein